VPEDFKGDDGYDFAKFRESHDELVAFKAQQEERLEQVPENADGYSLDIPDDIDFSDIEGLPEGFSVKPLTDEAFKPLFGEFAEFLHKIGAPADASKDAMKMIARYEATKFAEAVKVGRAELERLPKATERVQTVTRHLQKRLPEEMAQALNDNLTTAAGLQALEKLLSLGGPKSVTPQPPAGIDESLTPYERLQRARAAG